MSRYIDADVFMKNLKTNEHGDTDVNQVEIAINKSRADVVEVVRCKDCKYYKEYISHRGSAMMCFCPCCIGGQGKKKPTDYCSYGERKDDECE